MIVRCRAATRPNTKPGERPQGRRCRARASFSRPQRAAAPLRRDRVRPVLVSGQGVEEDRVEAFRLLDSAFSSRAIAGRLRRLPRPAANRRSAGAGQAAVVRRAQGRQVPSMRSAPCSPRGVTWPRRRYWREAAADGHVEAQERWPSFTTTAASRQARPTARKPWRSIAPGPIRATSAPCGGWRAPMTKAC